MTTIINGLLGGLIVAIVAAGAIRLLGDEPSVTGAFLAAVTGDRPPVAPWRRLLAELGYGTVAGGLLVALELFVLGVLAVPPSRGEALAVAGGWSIVLFLVALAAWRLGLDRPLDREAVGQLVAFHLVYGLGLAAWIRLTWIT